MALIRCNHKSSALGKASELTILVPETPKKEKLRILYLLHGLSDDYSAWLRYTSIERYVKYNSDTIIVMPDAGRSFYTDMVFGGSYYTYVTEEIPAFLKSLFNISEKREDTYIAGLSMGGYGAFKIALKNPEVYSAAASFSGALDVAASMKAGGEWKKDAHAIMGMDFSMEESDENLFCLLDKRFDKKPRLLQMCGTEDFLYASNLKFRDALKEKGFDYEYHEAPGGHTWDFWDECIKYALEFFGIENK